jgi:hypothetical protein
MLVLIGKHNRLSPYTMAQELHPVPKRIRCWPVSTELESWLPPGAPHCMDFEFEDRFRDLMKMKPNEYWRRQCKATFQFDPTGTKLVDDIGVETVMWGSDYPHTDGVWPESSKYIEEQYGNFPVWPTRFRMLT